MNLTEKLAKVDMSSDNRISASDRKYCETHQKAYESALENLKGLIFYWESVNVEQDDILGDYDKETRKYSSYITIEDFSLSKVEEKTYDIHERFIRFLVNYFDRTYHIELDVDTIINFLIPEKTGYDYTDRLNFDKRIEAWKKEMKKFSLKYVEILDQILIQLDGRTFLERALDEIIKNCCKDAWISNEPYFEIKGDTIRFKDYFCCYTDWYSSGNWSMTSRMKSIISAIYHFELGLFADYPYLFSRLFDRFDYSEIDFEGCNKIKTIKCFKNGRVDVKFTSKKSADEFADKYLGWVANGGIAV